ncbi:TraR/DksA family transcriptional regulator [candidate division KSB1 bacterium]
MNKQDKNETRMIIEAEINSLEKDISELDRQIEEMTSDEDTGINDIDTTNMNRASLIVAKERLTGLNMVLSGIDKPDFGICVKCKNPINIERIKVIPESRLCISCA